MKKIVLIVMTVVGVGAGAWYFFGPGSDMSGTYIGRNARQAFLVHIVQGANGKLSGFYEKAALSSGGGSVNQYNFPLTGQRDGETFTITLLPNGLAHFLVGSISLSGLYSGSSITLSGQGNSFTVNLNLIKGNSFTYGTYVARLNNQAQATQNMRAQRAEAERRQAALQARANAQALAAQNLENRITTDLNLMTTARTTVAIRLQQLGSDAEKLRSETAKMQVALEREAALGGHESGQGGQISAEIQQTNMNEADAIMGIHDRLMGIEQNGLPALLKYVKANDSMCERLNATLTTEPSFNGPKAELDDCLKLENATPQFENQVQRLIVAYRNVFATWNAENRKQQIIIRESQR
jgi:hypothetical protein